jgi:hypothetical protein
MYAKPIFWGAIMSQATDTSEEILKRLGKLTTVVEHIQSDVPRDQAQSSQN